MKLGAKYGLIGESLSHSYSKEIHALLGNPDYALLELPPDALGGFLRGADFLGINVTIPYKEKAMRHCEPDGEARKIGCVNTIVKRNGRLLGFNTDYFGFSFMAKSAGIDFGGKKVVILGSGGASKTAACVARDQGAREIAVVSRSGANSGANNYENICRHADADALVNATPVGMFPNADQSPVSLDCFKNLSAALDVVYNPLRTRLMLDAHGRGIKTANGLAMLAAQAARAHALFFGWGNCADDRAGALEAAQIAEVLSKTERLFLNVVLIGMPGCGKTSAGRELAKLLGMDFADTDSMIEESAGKKTGDIIRESGEPFFRELERAAVARAAAKTRAVIATGGGSVLARENRDALLSNGIVVFLERGLSGLAVEGRPLSSDLQALHRQRQPIYESLCHHRVRVAKSADETARIVREALGHSWV